ncbi:DUF1198 family protein [Shewanella sp. HN-41]|uniref:DUF1198 family protein n=1 Tax=Shewanella sp. HN-41 TaxID=327275 RepID=UPI000567BD3E|nr:DUF1198 family protein [Shewanella sp. HN-41]
MGWILFAVAIGVYFIYRTLSGNIRKASKIIGYSLNIKDTMVTECIGAMRTDPSAGPENTTRQRLFCESVIRSHGSIEKMSPLVKTFYIYQILKNPHDDNVSWWANRLKDCGFSAEITAHEREIFETFFEVDHGGFKEFVSVHNQTLI